MTQLWTIVDSASGAVLWPAFPTPGEGSHPKDNGWAWDATKHRAVRIDAAPDLAVQSWNGTIWTVDAAKIEAQLVVAVKVEAERRKMLVRSPGSGKGAEYRQKRTEAQASATVTAAALNALTKPATTTQYPAAAMEAELTGEKLATVLARYLTRSNAVEAEVMRLSAIEQAAVTKIKAATTATTKRAAYAALDWNWQPA